MTRHTMPSWVEAIFCIVTDIHYKAPTRPPNSFIGRRNEYLTLSFGPGETTAYDVII